MAMPWKPLEISKIKYLILEDINYMLQTQVPNGMQHTCTC